MLDHIAMNKACLLIMNCKLYIYVYHMKSGGVEVWESKPVLSLLLHLISGFYAK
jgi:hypothetical protein